MVDQQWRRLYSCGAVHVVIASVTNSYAYDANGNLLGDGTVTFARDVVKPPVTYTHSNVRLKPDATVLSASCQSLQDGAEGLGGAGECALADLEYDAHGAIWAMTARCQAPRNVFDFTAQLRDVETGMLYLRARYYEPTLGRFITMDRMPGNVLVPITFNGYIYANCNPATLKDPLGLTPQREGCDIPTLASGAFITLIGELPLVAFLLVTQVPAPHIPTPAEIRGLLQIELWTAPIWIPGVLLMFEACQVIDMEQIGENVGEFLGIE